MKLQKELSITCYCHQSMTIFYLLIGLLIGSPGQIQAKIDTIPSISYGERFKNMFKNIPFLDKAKSIDSTNLDSIKNKYTPVDWFAFINGINKPYYDSILKVNNGVLSWDSIHREQVITYHSNSIHPDSNTIIMGWHPYWTNPSAYLAYDFKLLNHLAWFAYDVNPHTGNYTNPEVIQQLKTQSAELLEKAKTGGCKVLLCITNHGRTNNNIFLDNHIGQQTVLIDSALHLLQTLNLDGVDLNFERLNPKRGREMTQFIKKFSNRLKTKNPDYVLSLTIPKLNKGRIAQLDDLNKYVDIFALTAYDFHTAGSSTDGPIAPLGSPNNKLNIKKIINTYITKGIHREKLILGLPYYGGAWTSKNPLLQNRNRNFKRHYTYRNIKAIYGKLGAPKYDTLSQSAYYIKKITPKQYEKVWFDDSLTLQIKYNWAKQQGLGGVAIWSLGYDNGHQELWGALGHSFRADTLINIVIETNNMFKTAAILINYETPLLLMVVFITFFGGLGFIISLFDWRVRNFLFEPKNARFFTITAILGLLLLVYALILSIQDKPLQKGQFGPLIIGMLIGGLVAGFVFWWKDSRKKLL